MASEYCTTSKITLLELPVDVLINIFTKLDLWDLRNVMLTCKTLKDLIVNDNSIWRLAGRDKLILHNSSDNKLVLLILFYLLYFDFTTYIYLTISVIIINHFTIKWHSFFIIICMHETLDVVYGIMKNNAYKCFSPKFKLMS